MSINRAIAVHLTKAVGTMRCVYAFTVLSLFPIAVPASNVAIKERLAKRKREQCPL